MLVVEACADKGSKKSSQTCNRNYGVGALWQAKLILICLSYWWVKIKS